jgi:hypothetical protein
MPGQLGVAVNLNGPSGAPILDAHDRCDRDGSRAYVWTVLVFSSYIGELFWCRHCWMQNREALAPHIGAMVNETMQLHKHIKDDRGVR